MSAFQTQINRDVAGGIVGEISHDGPTRAESRIVNSAAEENNRFGRAFTFNADGTVSAGGDGVFCGLMINPKAQAARGGIASDEFGLFVQNQSSAEFLSMGIVFVNTSTPARIGDDVFYSVATGEILTKSAGSEAIEGQPKIANAKVSRYEQLGANGGLISVTLTN